MPRSNGRMIAAAGAIALVTAVGPVSAADGMLAGVTGPAALAVAVAAAVAAAVALVMVRRERRRIDSLQRSLDNALRQIAQRRTQGTEPETAASTTPAITAPVAPGDAATAEAPAPKSVSAPASPPEDEAPSGLATALAENLARGDLQLALQPIVDALTNEPVGFEVFVHVVTADGETADIHALAEPAEGVDPAVFEAQRIRAAVEAGRRGLGARGHDLPLHCAVGAAFFSDAEQVAAIASLLAAGPSLARAVVLSAPSALLASPPPGVERNLAALAATGVRFAADGWDGPASALADVCALNCAFVKLDAAVLLDALSPRRRAAPAALLEAAAECGIAVIAAGVSDDEQALKLLDLGPTLMIGPRYSGPRLLRPA